MKRITKALTLLLSLCLLLSVSALAASAEPSAEPASGEASSEPAGGLAGTYTDGTSTLVINDDMTFTMNHVGLNLEAEEFVMIITGTVDAAGKFTIDGLFDGEINLLEVATPDQVANDLAKVEAVFAAGKADDASADPSAEPSGEAGAVQPGTYTDGTSTLVINDDMTFTMNHVGLNLEAEEFVMIITGTVDAAGNFTIDGLFDGEINLIEVATPDQVAADLATVEAVYAAGK